MPGKLPGPAACRSCFHRFVLPWGLGVDALDKVGGSSCGVGSSFIIPELGDETSYNVLFTMALWARKGTT
jgi:hypothetical protein